MTLSETVARLRRQIYDDLRSGQPPSVGRYSESDWKQARDKGEPRMGTYTLTPEEIRMEFLYSAAEAPALIFTVTVPAPERIVFLPVPDWVVESIWQGEIDGTYHFESDARRLLAEFERLLEPAENRRFFGPQRPKRRE